jgi:hypothetical protein
MIEGIEVIIEFSLRFGRLICKRVVQVLGYKKK